MKVYFSTSISKMTNQLKKSCNLICDHLEELGCLNLFERRFNNRDQYFNKTEEENLLEQQMISKQKREADIIVVEVTHSSIGIGQEISMALLHNKFVIALHKDSVKPHILKDIKSDKLIVLGYNKSNLREIISNAIHFISKERDQRFNLMLSSDLVNFLNKKSQKINKSKAEIIRSLLIEEMGKEDKYY